MDEGEGEGEVVDDDEVDEGGDEYEECEGEPPLPCEVGGDA